MANQLDQRLYESFRRVKNDIMKLQEQINSMSQNQERILEFAQKNRERQVVLDKKMQTAELKAQKAASNKTAAKRASRPGRTKSVFVASKEGAKFHSENCPFAKNIRPKMRVLFRSKVKALNKGLKPCACVTRV